MTRFTGKACTGLIVCVVIISLSHLHVLGTEAPPDYEDVFDFGSVSTRPNMRRVFVISNRGDNPLAIKNARSSSNLVHILSYPQQIPPHGTGDLELELFPSEPGEVKSEILLDTTSSPDAVLRYALKATIKADISTMKKTQPDLDIPPELITRKMRKRDPQFGISVESVLRKLKKKEEIVLIDVRNREEFEKFRISGSINMPLFSVRTKTFFKSKSVVLINEGFHYGPLEQACKRLKGSGFSKARILNGGLNAWKQEGGALTGDIFAQQALNRMPPQIFFEEKNDENWLVMDVTRSRRTEARYLIPHSVSIPFTDDSKEFVSRLTKAISRYKENPLLSVLIFDDRGDQYEKIETVIQEAQIGNVFYLKDGLDGYRAFLNRYALMWQPKQYSTRTVRKCAECP